MVKGKKQLTDDPIGIVNASGFAFQLAVEHCITTTTSQHGWQVAAREYPWSPPPHRRSDSGGFIDLVLERGQLRAVVECKRNKVVEGDGDDGAKWVFVVPGNRQDLVGRFSWFYTRPRKQTPTRAEQAFLGNVVADWADGLVPPDSKESQFCAVRGTGEDHTPMLERLCHGLLRSVEAIAIEETELTKETVLYAPVIITNARLLTCEVDLGEVSLRTGKVSDDSAVEEVPFIRFRKAFGWRSPSKTPRGLADAARIGEQSVLVVNSEHVPELLSKFHDVKPHSFESPPWLSAWRRE